MYLFADERKNNFHAFKTLSLRYFTHSDILICAYTKKTACKLTYCGNKLSQQGPVSWQSICICAELEDKPENWKSHEELLTTRWRHRSTTQMFRLVPKAFRYEFGPEIGRRKSTLRGPLRCFWRIGFPRLMQVPLAQREKIRKQIRADTKDILVKRVFFLQPLHPLFLSTYKNMVSLFTLLLPRRCICLSRNFDGLCWFPDIPRRHKLGQAKLNFLMLKDLWKSHRYPEGRETRHCEQSSQLSIKEKN